MKKLLLVLAILMMVSALVFAGGQSGSSTRLTVEIFDRGTDGGRTNAADNPWTDWIKEKVKKDLNIDLVFHPVGRWTEDTDIVNLMASGSAPDLCYTYNTGMITEFRARGGILDLAPNIDRLLPDMKRLLGSDPAIAGQELIYRDRDPATGRIYSIPSYVVNLARKNLFIRKDWLDTLGLAVPRTTAEFHNALVAFRTSDPGRVGAANVIPFGQDADARWGFSPIVHAYFNPNLSAQERWVTEFSDRPIAVPGYKDGLRVINQWYNEGLILRDFPLLTVPDDYFAMLKTGRIGAYGANWDHPYRQDLAIQQELAQNVPGASFIPIDAIQAPDGVTRKEISDKPGLRIFVPASSRNSEAAMRYLNWLSIHENYNFLQIGNAGVNHNMVNGVPQVINPSGGNARWIQNSANNIDYTIPMNGIEMGSADLNARVLALGYGSIPTDVIVNAFNVSVSNGRAPAVYQAATTLDGTYGASLREKADALIAQAVTATVANFDRVWDDGMADYLRSGAQEVMDERRSLWR